MAVRALGYHDMPSLNLRKRLSDIKFLITQMENRFGPPPQTHQEMQEFASKIQDLLCPVDHPLIRKRERRSQFSWRTIADLARAEKRNRRQ